MNLHHTATNQGWNTSAGGAGFSVLLFPDITFL